MPNPKSEIRNPKLSRGFTLMELLVVIGIIAILAALAAVGMAGAINQARVGRTRSQINKIDTLIMEKYESYRTRAVPVRAPPTAGAAFSAGLRLSAIRELMRIELPDRRSDIVNLTTSPPSMEVTVTGVPSAMTAKYFRLALRARGGNPSDPTTYGVLTGWTRQHQGAECLYLILSAMKDGDKSAIEFFPTDEIGDVDEDGMREILDGFGRPIEFLRWAPGYSEHPGPDGQWGVAGVNDDNDPGGNVDDIFEAGWPGSDDIKPPTLQTRIALKHTTNLNIEAAPDPYDPLKVDPRWTTGNPPFALKPLIFSAGLDGEYEISTLLEDPQGPPADTDFRYSQTSLYPVAGSRPSNDPYFIPPSATWTATPLQLGRFGDLNGDGYQGWADNITNHFIEPQ